MKDYTVNTAITSHTGFNDRKCDCLMYERMKEVIKHDIQTAFLSDESLEGYIISDLTLRFLGGHKARVEYEFSCCDESKQEAEGLSNYCVKGVQGRLEELGHHIEGINSKAEETSMGWLDELESMVFRQREETKIQSAGLSQERVNSQWDQGTTVTIFLNKGIAAFFMSKLHRFERKG